MIEINTILKFEDKEKIKKNLILKLIMQQLIKVDE